MRLKISDLDLKPDLPKTRVRAEYTKSGVGGRVVFMSYEARDAVRDWLEARGKLRKRATRRVLEALKRRGERGDFASERVWPISFETATAIWRNALRKFFRSNLGLDSDVVNALMGHVGYLDAAYRRYKEDELAEMYKGAMHNISIYVMAPLIPRGEASRIELNALVTLLKAQGEADD